MGYKLNHGVLFLEEIYTAVIYCENIKDSAMVLLMLSSNMNSDFLSVLTVGDLLDACSDYLDDKNSVVELLELNPWYVVPCWRNVANQKILSFNTPEATFHILLYLKKRQSSSEELNRESPLFLGKEISHIAPKTIRDNITDLKSKDFHVDFTQTSLLKTFKFVCENYCDNKDLVKLLLMEDVETNPLYGKTSAEVREYYKPLIPFLTAKSFDDKKGVVNDTLDTDSIISNYYEEYINHRKVEYDFKEELKIKKIANSHFELYEDRELTPQQLEIIYKFAECERLIQKKPLFKEEVYPNFKAFKNFPNDESCIDELYNYFNELGIIEILEISEERTRREIIKQSVNIGVDLMALTEKGFSAIFYELLKAVLLDDTYSLSHLYF